MKHMNRHRILLALAEITPPAGRHQDERQKATEAPACHGGRNDGHDSISEEVAARVQH